MRLVSTASAKVLRQGVASLWYQGCRGRRPLWALWLQEEVETFAVWRATSGLSRGSRWEEIQPKTQSDLHPVPLTLNPGGKYTVGAP